MRYISKINPKFLRGTALLRLDLNTEDDWRMKASLPIIKFLIRHADKVLILSHKGRPKGTDKKLSLRRDAARLQKLLKKEVRFIGRFDFRKIKRTLDNVPPKSILILENLRFMPGEEKNDAKFARSLARLGDFYVNDAFAVSHRVNASVAAITRFLPSCGGFELEAEVKNLSKVMRSPRRPLIVILGGAKIGDKLGIARYFRARAASFLIGGALANTLLRIRGVDIGASRTDGYHSREAKALAKDKKTVLPVDFRWFGPPAGGKIFDIGPKTEKEFAKQIARARTIIWNGPLGVIEDKKFRRGTRAVAASIAKNRRAFSVAGGGETVMTLKQFGLDKKISFVSTGGGAMLEFLAGKKLPGIVALGKPGKVKKK